MRFAGGARYRRAFEHAAARSNFSVRACRDHAHPSRGEMVSRFAGAGDSTPGWSKFAFELRICLEFRFWIGGSKARAKLCSSMSPQQIAYYGRGLDLHTRGPIMAVSLS